MKTLETGVQAALERVKSRVERTLIAYDSVTGVSLGYKYRDGMETDIPAIIVYVRKKGDFPANEEIPATIGDVQIDVVGCVFKPSNAAEDTGADTGPDTTRYDPLKGGCSAGAAAVNEAGTMGVQVVDNATGDNVLLSNWHVFCEGAGDDTKIVQPGTLDGGTVRSDFIGNVLRSKLGEISKWPWNYYVDCAICDLSGGRASSNSILQIGALAGINSSPIEGALVRKYGRSTRHTYGAVRYTNASVKVDYPSGPITFYYQYQFNAPSPSMPQFAAAGDSGSVVVDSELKAIGLIFAGGSTDNGWYIATANPMYMVLEALDISIT